MGTREAMIAKAKLKKTITELERKNAALEKRVSDLEMMLDNLNRPHQPLQPPMQPSPYLPVYGPNPVIYGEICVICNRPGHNGLPCPNLQVICQTQ